MADMVEAAREAREADEISDNAKNENEAFQERDEQNTHGPGSTRVSLVTEKEAAPSLLPPLENRTEFPAQEGQAADEEYDDEETEDDDEVPGHIRLEAVEAEFKAMTAHHWLHWLVGEYGEA